MHKQIVKRVALLGVALFAVNVVSSTAVLAAEYVGDNANKCNMCHKKQVTAWKTWPMSKSWETLQKSSAKKDSCIPCHVTGFGKPGGFVSIAKTPKLVGIQCEACHGPASDHMKAPLKDVEKRKKTVVKPTEASCKTCHKKEGNPNFKEFKYAEAVKTLANHKGK